MTKQRDTKVKVLAELEIRTLRSLLEDLQDSEKRTPALYTAVLRFLNEYKEELKSYTPNEAMQQLLDTALADFTDDEDELQETA